MILEPKPKRRSLGRYVWPLAITAAVAIALVVSGSSRDTKADLDYVEAMHDEVSEISLGAVSLRDVSRRLFSVDRVEFVAVTDGLRADLATARNRVGEAMPSDPLIAVNQLYGQALEAWTRGVSGFTSGVLRSADDPDDEFVEDLIAESLAELRAGDQIYLALLEELAMEDIPDPAAPMPEITMMPGEGALLSLSQTYVAAARSSSNNLALLSSLGLTMIVSEPQMIVDPSGQAAVPATETISFTVVVTNSGNVASELEMLRLTMSGGAETIELTAAVPALVPGRQTTVTFEALSVEAGLVYEVSAALLVTNPDTTLDDNEISVVFVVNEA